MAKKEFKLAEFLPQRQMSEAFINSFFLALSGGFQDAYTYNCRDEIRPLKIQRIKPGSFDRLIRLQKVSVSFVKFKHTGCLIRMAYAEEKTAGLVLWLHYRYSSQCYVCIALVYHAVMKITRKYILTSLRGRGYN